MIVSYGAWGISKLPHGYGVEQVGIKTSSTKVVFKEELLGSGRRICQVEIMIIFML